MSCPKELFVSNICTSHPETGKELQTIESKPKHPLIKQIGKHMIDVTEL